MWILLFFFLFNFLFLPGFVIDFLLNPITSICFSLLLFWRELYRYHKDSSFVIFFSYTITKPSGMSMIPFIEKIIIRIIKLTLDFMTNMLSVSLMICLAFVTSNFFGLFQLNFHPIVFVFYSLRWKSNVTKATRDSFSIFSSIVILFGFVNGSDKFLQSILLHSKHIFIFVVLDDISFIY